MSRQRHTGGWVCEPSSLPTAAVARLQACPLRKGQTTHPILSVTAGLDRMRVRHGVHLQPGFSHVLQHVHRRLSHAPGRGSALQRYSVTALQRYGGSGSKEYSGCLGIPSDTTPARTGFDKTWKASRFQHDPGFGFPTTVLRSLGHVQAPTGRARCFIIPTSYIPGIETIRSCLRQR